MTNDIDNTLDLLTIFHGCCLTEGRCRSVNDAMLRLQQMKK